VLRIEYIAALLNHCHFNVKQVVAWLSVNVLVLINIVTLHRARLVLGWVTICGRVNHLGVKPATEVDSAFYPPWDGKMSISFRDE